MFKILAFCFAYRVEAIRNAGPVSDFEACVRIALFFAMMALIGLGYYYFTRNE